MAATYNDHTRQRHTFKFYALYKDATGDAIDLAGQSARMQVRQKS